MRKGLALGTGRGYKNIIGRDPSVHSASAKGMKQPENVNIFTPKFFNESASLFNKQTNSNPESSDDYVKVRDILGNEVYKNKKTGQEWLIVWNEKGVPEWKLLDDNKKPYKLLTINNQEVWQLPKSQYMIEYLSDEKGDNRWRVMQVYVTQEGEIRTRGDLPYIDHESYLDALEHIKTNAEIDSQLIKRWSLRQ